MQKSILIAMRLTLILLVCGLHVAAKSSSQTISITGKDMSLYHVFEVIKEQTGYGVFGNAKLLKEAKLVTANAVNMPLEKFLQQIFKDQPLNFRLLEKSIFIYGRDEPDDGKPKAAPPPGYEPLRVTPADPIKGRVTNEEGKPLQGATITIKGTKTAVSTNDKGEFSIAAKEGQVLVFSYVGMEPKEFKLGDVAKPVNISLKNSEAQLKDMVVTGFTNVRKESFTGNAITVTREEILKVSNQNVMAVLQVFDPSLRVEIDNMRGSDPNRVPDFYIRGKSGIGVKELDNVDVSKAALVNNPNLPVFMMDGYEVTAQRVYDFDPNRIKSITILKDAAATAIYGSRAANGVIVIETLMPKPGKLHISYTANAKLAMPDLSFYNLMNAEEKIRAELLSGLYDANDPGSPAFKNTHAVADLALKQNQVVNGVNTDWISKPLRNSVNHRHTLTIDGGSEYLRYNLSLGVNDVNGVMKKSNRNNKYVGLNLVYSKGTLQIMNSINYDVNKSNGSPYGSFSQYLQKNPYDRIYDDNGFLLKNNYQWLGMNLSELVNPLYEVMNTNNFDRSITTGLSNNLSINWRAIRNLMIRAQVAITKSEDTRDVFTDPASGKYVGEQMVDFSERGELAVSTAENTNMSGNLIATYMNVIGPHNVNMTLGLNVQTQFGRGLATSYRGFPSGSQYSPNFANKVVGRPMYNDKRTRLGGGLFQLNYSWKDIYLFDLSGRLDASSEFGIDKRFAPFWSVGTGVNVHKYAFMQQFPFINSLRITGAVGRVGKANFAPYAARDIYYLLQGWYNSGIGVDLKYLGNPNLGWEKTNSYDLIFSLAFLNRFTLNVNWYNRIVINSLTDVNLPMSSGYKSYMDNLGQIKNTGVDIAANAEIYRSKNWMISVGANLSHNKNTIKEVSRSLQKYNELVDAQYEGYENHDADPKFAKTYTKYVEGGSTTSIFGMRSLGINPTDGKEVFLKRDGTITYDWSVDEQVIIGNREPKAKGSIMLGITYKRLSLFVSAMYKLGADLYNSTLVTQVENARIWGANADRRALLDRWVNPGDITQIKNIRDSRMATRPTSRFIQREKEIALNSMSLNYTINESKWLKSRGISGITIQAGTNSTMVLSTVRQERGLNYPFERTIDLTINARF